MDSKLEAVRAKARAKYWSRPEARAAKLAKARARYANDPELRARLKKRPHKPKTELQKERHRVKLNQRYQNDAVHRAKRKERAVADYYKNRDRELERKRSRYAADPEYRERFKERVRMSNHGVNNQQRAAMLEKQGGACAICGYSDTSVPQRFPVVDHDHQTGMFRGMLCGPCNAGLGHFKDSPELLENAAEYLRVAAKSRVA